MSKIKNILILISASLILFPSIVDFVHVFNDHGHQVCNNYSQKHFHSASFDCELHKFQKNPALEINFIAFKPIKIFTIEKHAINIYQFLNDYQSLPFELRGPPCSFTVAKEILS